jgi:hypothetical protein
MPSDADAGGIVCPQHGSLIRGLNPNQGRNLARVSNGRPSPDDLATKHLGEHEGGQALRTAVGLLESSGVGELGD